MPQPRDAPGSRARCGAGSARSRRCWCSRSWWPSCTTSSRTCTSSSVFAHLHAIPRRQILAALGFTALSYWLLTTYEVLALRYLQRVIPYARIVFTSFIAYSFGHTLGFAVFTGSAIRFRLYVTAGVTAVDVATVTAFCSLSLGIGLATISGLSLLLSAGARRDRAAPALTTGRCWSACCC